MFRPDFSEINRGETVGVALSGGKDSVCLLHCIISARKELGISLCVINVEHGIRGDASKKDTDFCRKLALSLGLPFYTFSVDAISYAKENSLSIEESARVLRYAKFFEAIDRGYCDKIAVAHHLSDSVETILFNLLRGSSLSGAKGISAENYGGKIIRPLLDVSHEEISLYVDKHRLLFVQDETNFYTDYTRNAIRLELMPKIKKIFPKAEAALKRFAALAKEDDDYLYSEALRSLESDGEKYRFSIDLPRPIKNRCVIIALKKLGLKKDYEKVHVDDVVSLSDNISGKKTVLPKSLIAVREGGYIVIKRANFAVAETVLPFTLGETYFNDYLITCEKLSAPPTSFSNGLYFDADKIPAQAVFRTKKTGDYFTKFGGGKVSLKKYLTDCKFPESKKSATPLIAFDKTVYCVCEKDVSSLIKIDNDTVNIIKLTCKKLKR